MFWAWSPYEWALLAFFPTQKNTERDNEKHRKQKVKKQAKAKQQGLTKFRLESAPKRCCRLSFVTLLLENYKLCHGFVACYLMRPAIKVYTQTQGEPLTLFHSTDGGKLAAYLNRRARTSHALNQ